MIDESYRMTAPKKLVALLDGHSSWLTRFPIVDHRFRLRSITWSHIRARGLTSVYRLAIPGLS